MVERVSRDVRACMVFGCRASDDSAQFTGGMCNDCYRLITQGVLAIRNAKRPGTTFIHILIRNSDEANEKLEAVRKLVNHP